MTNNTPLNTARLVELGARRWQTPDGTIQRLYFPAQILDRAVNLDVSYYGTGNVSSATRNGKKISNSEAKRIVARLSSFASNAWVNAVTGQVESRTLDQDSLNEIHQLLETALAAEA